MRIFFLGFLVVLVSAPFILFAQIVPCNGPECQACHLIELGDNIIDFLISIFAAIGTIMFAVAGLIMVTSGGDESRVKQAKSVMTNVVIGFIILLSAWLIVDTVMKTFVGNNLGRPWQSISCEVSPAFTVESSRVGSGAGGVFDGTAGEVPDSVARALLEGEGVTIYATDNCSDPDRRTCTSLNGMRLDTVDQVLAIQEACPTCNVVVSGGTETGHQPGTYSHANGYKVDIDDGNPTLNTYLRNNLTRSGNRSGDPRYVDSCGNEYVRESSHWDITVNRGVCKF